MATITPRLGLVKPEVNGPETDNVWGFDVNDNFDKLDAFAASVALDAEAIDDRVAALLVAGANITLQYNDAVNQLTISATGGGGGGSGVTDGDKGDIVVSGSGATWMFDPTVVTTMGKSLIDDADAAAMRTTLGITTSGVVVATAAEYRANVPDKVLDTDGVWAAAVPVLLTYAATMAPDMATFINAEIPLSGPLTLANPTNPKPGQTGTIYFIQDPTGGRTLTLGTNWKMAAAADAGLTTTGNAVDRAVYFVRSATHIDIDISLDRS